MEGSIGGLGVRDVGGGVREGKGGNEHFEIDDIVCPFVFFVVYFY